LDGALNLFLLLKCFQWLLLKYPLTTFLFDLAVVFDDCTSRTSFLFHSEDSRFKVDGDGTLKLKRGLTLHNGHKEFYVSTQSKGKKIMVPVRVLHEARHGHHHNHHEMTTQPKVYDWLN
jgi:hypothetical protein